MLKLQIDALTQTEKTLNIDDPEKERLFQERIHRLAQDAATAKLQADQEEQKYMHMKQNLEDEIARKKSVMEEQTKAATAKINELDDKVTTSLALKLS